VTILFSSFFPAAGPDPFHGCLPKEVALESIVSGENSKSASGSIQKTETVRQTLARIKARCRRGKLVDGAGKQIYFYHLIGCWGNPPENYMELLERQDQEIQRLKKKYRVIQISCAQNGDPRLIH
jgi:hypothetical protein